MFRRGFKTWCESTAIQQRKALRLRPFDPLDPVALARQLGIRVWAVEQIPDLSASCLKVLVEDDADSWSALTLCDGSKRLIVSNSAHSRGRQASDLMHELAHILIGHTPAELGITEGGLLMLDSYDKQQEEEATWLTGCLLLPREAVIYIRRRELDEGAIERVYGVTPSMWRYRVGVTGVDKQLSSYRQKRNVAVSKRK
jgi:Zn-dependent peptidase ImmA (M78 family)